MYSAVLAFIPILVFTLQTVHFKVHDPKMHCKGSSRENTITRGGSGGGGGYGPPPGPGGGGPKYRSMHSRGGSSMGRYDEEAPPPPSIPQGLRHRLAGAASAVWEGSQTEER